MQIYEAILSNVPIVLTRHTSKQSSWSCISCSSRALRVGRPLRLACNNEDSAGNQQDLMLDPFCSDSARMEAWNSEPTLVVTVGQRVALSKAIGWDMLDVHPTLCFDGSDAAAAALLWFEAIKFLSRSEKDCNFGHDLLIRAGAALLLWFGIVENVSVSGNWDRNPVLENKPCKYGPAISYSLLNFFSTSFRFYDQIKKRYSSHIWKNGKVFCRGNIYECIEHFSVLLFLDSYWTGNPDELTRLDLQKLK